MSMILRNGFTLNFFQNCLDLGATINKMLDIGIIFTEDYNSFKSTYNQTVIADFNKDLYFDEISKIKNILPVTDGLFSFLVVEKSRMKIKGHMTSLIPFDNLIASSDYLKKSADLNDLILSIRNGLVKLLKGDNDFGTIEIFEKIRNEIKIRSTSYNRKQVTKIIKDKIANKEPVNLFSDTIFELSRIGKGTIFVLASGNQELKGLCDGYEVGNMNLDNKLPDIHKNNKKQYKSKYFEKIKQMAKTDGAIVIDNQMNVIRFGATLENKSEENNGATTDKTHVGGKKHISSLIFSENNPESLVITISDDGPISIFSNGKRILKI